MTQQKWIVALVFWTLSSTAFAATTKSLASQQKQDALLVELTGQDISKESDATLYAEMVGASRNSDEIGFKSRLQALLSHYPQSTYADSALFLAGRMAIDHGNYAEAIRYFARIEKEYPHGKRAVSAHFDKAMVYKKINLPEIAKQILKDVRAKYPGSPESFRADNEIKLIN